MTFEVLTGPAPEQEALVTAYSGAERIGRASIGGGFIFYRSGLKLRVAELSAVTNYFRRVHEVPAKLCCGKGSFDVSSIVVCDGRGELMEMEMPDERHAKLLMSRLGSAAPLAKVGYKKSVIL